MLQSLEYDWSVRRSCFMNNFMQYAPTEIVFGKDAEKEAGRLAK